MINHPVTYQRDFQNDFSSANLPCTGDLSEKCQRVALAALPLLSLHRPFRGPLSLAMSGLRAVTHIAEMIQRLQREETSEACFALLHASLAASAVGLFFFNPVFSFLASSVSDLIVHCRSFIEHAREGDVLKILQDLAFMAADALFLASLCFGSIEITVACMVLQMALDFVLSAKHFINGNYLEGVCQATMAGAHFYRAIPQMRLLQWKWQHNPVLTAELKRSGDFVYLDIPDEYVRTLFELCEGRAELPPYFGPGMAGAHVSVMTGDEPIPREISDLGKRFSFSIVNMDSVKPDGWKGVNKVYFLTLSCPELEEVRIRHGLSPRMHGHDFHLTFGIERERARAVV